MEVDKHQHFKIKLAVSGAAEADHCGPQAYDKALEVGREIARQNCVQVNGATTGLPFWAAKGGKEEKGFVIGISPAVGEVEHVERYKLPLDYLDLIVYTGGGYAERDILMTRSADAIIILCGRVGTIHEFTVAFEDTKPIGILEQNGPTADVIKFILEKGNRKHPKLIYDSDPRALVERLVALAKKDKVGHGYALAESPDGLHDTCVGPDCPPQAPPGK